MHLRILTLLCCLSVLVLATGKLEDKSDIEDLEKALVLVVDDKEYVKASQLFTPNATTTRARARFGPWRAALPLLNSIENRFTTLTGSASSARN